MFKECVIANENSNMHKVESATSLKKLLHYYSELHAQEMREHKQILITRFMEPQHSTLQDLQPNTSQEAADLFDEDVITDSDFDDFLEEAAAVAASESASTTSLSTSDGVALLQAGFSPSLM